MRKFLLLVLILVEGLLPLPLYGAERRSVNRGETVTVEIATAPGFGTIITLPEIPEKVGTGDNTNFHVEVYGDTLMVKPKTPVIDAKTNLFALLSGNTVVTFKVRSTEPDLGMDVVTLGWTDQRKLPDPSPKRTATNQSVQDLLEKIEFRKRNKSGRSEKIRIRIKGTATLDQKTYLKFEIKNRGKRIFEVESVSLLLQQMGGVTGGKVQEETAIDSESTFSSPLIEPKGTVSGLIGFSRIDLKRNERLLLKFTEAGDRGRVITINPGAL